MKLKIYINLVFSLCLTVVSLSSCSDDSIGAEYGNTLIYMPQATHNLGIDNNLNLTVNVDEASEDPSVKTSTTLGIYRSGTAPKETVTVDLIIDTDSLARAKALAEENPEASAYDIYRTGVLLEEQYYEQLPAQLTIPDGSREATTQLILKNTAICEDYQKGQILLLPVRICNPTKYSLNYSLALTMVVIELK